MPGAMPPLAATPTNRRAAEAIKKQRGIK